MATPLLIGLGVVGSLVAVSVAWRFASRRQSLPCPVWLRWFVELDNPFTSTNRSNVIAQQLDLRPGMRVLDVRKPQMSATSAFCRRATVTRLALAAGFRERAFYGNRIAYSMLLEKPA